MRHEFRLADIGEGLEEAEIISWLVSVGDVVERDQPLVEVMTDKSNAELPAPNAGVIVELPSAVGDMVSVGELIAVIDDGLASSPSPVAPTPSPAAVSSSPDNAGSQRSIEASDAADQPVTKRPKASPSTRRAAAERGIDLTGITGTGPGGRILLADLDQPERAGSDSPSPSRAGDSSAISSQATVPAAVTLPVADSAPASFTAAIDATNGDGAESVPLRGIRRAVARNMAQSWSEIPHIHAFDEIDASALLELRERMRSSDHPAYQNLTPLAFFVAAVARALDRHRQANALIDMDRDRITYRDHVNVGVAVAAEHGLVVPVMQAVEQLDFETLSRNLAALVRGAREGTLGREHFLGGTVTITNFGSLGGEQATPLIRPGESMIVGFGSIKQRPFVRDGDVVAAPTMHLVAGADHRLLDGDITTAVLGDVAASLRDPLGLVL